MRFYFDANAGAFISNEHWLDTTVRTDFLSEGITAMTHERSRLVFGPNLLEVRVKSYARLLMDEVCSRVEEGFLTRCARLAIPSISFSW